MKMPAVQTQFFPFNGGLDEVTPPFALKPGVLRSVSNMEVGVNGGYSRLAGYERYDGRAKPSDATYAILTCDISGAAVGDVLQNFAGTAYGTIIALPTGQAVLTLITGTFSTGNVYIAGPTLVGTCTGPQSTSGASTAALNATYNNLAADVYRALIQVVPGTGNVLGVWQYNGSVYAVRNHSGGTYALLYVKSASGWTAVTLYNEVSFTAGGITAPADGTTLTQGANTATIKRVVLTSGSWTGGNAAGRFIVTTPAPGAFAAGAATIGAINVTLSGAQTAITLSPSGRYEFVNWNFGSGQRVYGCDGVNKGFEFDGTVYVPIATGMTTDTPTHVAAHKNHLVFSFAGSAQHSGTGFPYMWSPVTGAAELSCGDTVTGFLPVPGTSAGGALAIYTRNRTLVLYGNDASDWQLVPFSEEAGALPYTQQFITQGFSLDTQGIVSLATTQEYGNFVNSVVSRSVSKSLNPIISLVKASCVVRKKNQYRVFFSNGSAFYMTMDGRKIAGITAVSLVDEVLCICSAEGSDGQEQIYFGSGDGYVYQMDIGTSFDGDPISWQGTLAFNHIGGPRQLKTFRKGVTEVSGTDYCEFDIGYSLSYGSDEFAAGTSATIQQAMTSMTWDAFTWDSFYWDGRSLTPAEFDISGTAENISLIFSGNSDEFEPFTLNGEIIHYTQRRNMR